MAVDSYQQTGKISRPFLGVRYVILNDALATREKLPRSSGALIIGGQTVNDFAVLPGSPAEKAGLKENDIIVSIDGHAISEQNTLPHILKDYRPGQAISMVVFRDGSEKTVSLTLGDAQ